MHITLYYLIFQYTSLFHATKLMLTSKQLYYLNQHNIHYIKIYNSLHQYIFNLNKEYNNTLYYLQNKELNQLTFEIYNYILNDLNNINLTNNIYNMLGYPDHTKPIKHIIKMFNNNINEK